MAKFALNKLTGSYLRNESDEYLLTQPTTIDDNFAVDNLENEATMTRLLLAKDAQPHTASDMQELCSRFSPLPCEAGQIIVEQGNAAEFVYVLISGQCKVTRSSENELHDIELKELNPGESFGEEALVHAALRQTTITMLTDGSVLMLSKDEYVSVLTELLISAVSADGADVVIANGGRWLDVGSTLSHGDRRQKDAVQIPMKFLRHKSMVLNPERHYVITSATLNHSYAAAQVLQQCGFRVSVLDQHTIN